MNVADYGPMTREYAIWNATIASLQFWAADPDPITLCITIEEVYSAFFYSTSTYTLHQQPDEILFGHFMTTLNAAFEWKLAQEDEGYESGSETINMPTPLRKMPRIHYIASIDHASFNPDPVIPHSMFCTAPRLVCRQLTFSLSDNSDAPEDTLPAPRATPTDAQVYLEDEEEDFQTVPLDDKHWTSEEVPERTSIPYCMDYAHIHALMQITYSLPTLTLWI